MTTFHQLPQELFPHIFKNLDFHELTEAQKVCRMWYRPAHIALLKNISLNSEHQIERFIASIDQNTSSSYLAAVEKVVIQSDEEYGVDYQFDEKNVIQLFCRFPNLAQVSINTFSSCLEKVNDGLCDIILKNCPKLGDFEVLLRSQDDEDEDVYCGTLYKLRSLLTTIDMENVDFAAGFGGTTNYITSFPRLRQIYNTYNQALSIREYISILEHLPNLTSISIDPNDNVEEDLEERYLLRKPKEQQDIIVRRFSRITDLQYAVNHPFCPSSIKFIAKYLTGLETLFINASFQLGNWTFVHQQVLLDEMMRLAVRDDGSISISYLQPPIIAECLPIITHKLFSGLTSTNRVLHLDTRSYSEIGDALHFHIRWPTRPAIDIRLINQQSTNDIISTLFKNEINYIDHLVFLVQQRGYYKKYVDNQTYLSIFKAIPSLKKATLDIPKSYKTIKLDEEPDQHTCMEKLTLRPSTNVQIQPMLDTFARMFPNLKYLNLYYYGGIWKKRLQAFHIDLTNYTLERLVLDLTPLKRSMKKQGNESDFFVVQVESLEKMQRYKLPLDLSSVTIATDEDSEALLSAHISIKSLKRLEACMYLVDGDDEEYLREYRARTNVNCITIF